MKKIMILGIIVCIILMFIEYSNSNSTTEHSYNSIINESISENGKYKAVKFSRSINSTTKLSYQLSVMNANEYLDDSKGNIYISYEDFDYRWEENELIIVISNEDTVFLQNKKYKKVNVFYEYK